MPSTTLSIDRLSELREQRDRAAVASEAKRKDTESERERYLSACRELGRVVASEHFDFEQMSGLARLTAMSIAFTFQGRGHQAQGNPVPLPDDPLGVEFPGQAALYKSRIGTARLKTADECVAFVAGVKEVFDQVNQLD